MPPNVRVTKSDQGATSVAPSTTGVLAIIASGTGTVQNQPVSFTRPQDILASTTNGGMGPGCRLASYYLEEANRPVVLVLCGATTVGAYGTVVHTTVTGTAVPVAGGTAPIDEFAVVWRAVNNITLGTTGGIYQYSLDGGSTFSGQIALGTALSVTLNYLSPAAAGSTGVSFTLGTAAQTFNAGDTFTCLTSRPQPNNADLVTALAALKSYVGSWDNLLVDVDATAQMIQTVDGWLTGLGTRWKMSWMNTRHKTLTGNGLSFSPSETEAAYLTAMNTIVSAVATDNVDVGADGGFCPDPFTGLNMFGPTSLAIATRANPSPTGQDPAWVAKGAVPGFTIFDANGNPYWHNEDDSTGTPGLDAARMSTLRFFPGKNGTYITNARLLSGPQSPYQYDQHARTMNAFLTAGYPLLTNQLSAALRKQAPDPVTGKIFVLEADLESMEEYVNPIASQEVDGQVNAAAFVLSRTDDASNQAGFTLNADAEVVSLAYPKQINVVATLTKTIQLSPTPSATAA